MLTIQTLADFCAITTQKVHAVHRGYTEVSQWMLIACLGRVELGRRKGNHRIVAFAASSRDMGTE